MGKKQSTEKAATRKRAVKKSTSESEVNSESQKNFSEREKKILSDSLSESETEKPLSWFMAMIGKSITAIKNGENIVTKVQSIGHATQLHALQGTGVKFS